MSRPLASFSEQQVATNAQTLFFDSYQYN